MTWMTKNLHRHTVFLLLTGCFSVDLIVITNEVTVSVIILVLLFMESPFFSHTWIPPYCLLGWSADVHILSLCHMMLPSTSFHLWEAGYPRRAEWGVGSCYPPRFYIPPSRRDWSVTGGVERSHRSLPNRGVSVISSACFRVFDLCPTCAPHIVLIIV